MLSDELREARLCEPSGGGSSEVVERFRLAIPGDGAGFPARLLAGDVEPADGFSEAVKYVGDGMAEGGLDVGSVGALIVERRGQLGQQPIQRRRPGAARPVDSEALFWLILADFGWF